MTLYKFSEIVLHQSKNFNFFCDSWYNDCWIWSELSLPYCHQLSSCWNLCCRILTIVVPSLSIPHCIQMPTSRFWQTLFWSTFLCLKQIIWVSCSLMPKLIKIKLSLLVGGVLSCSCRFSWHVCKREQSWILGAVIPWIQGAVGVVPPLLPQWEPVNDLLQLSKNRFSLAGWNLEFLKGDIRCTSG